jgi:hypothetical protein
MCCMYGGVCVLLHEASSSLELEREGEQLDAAPKIKQAA